MLITQKQEPGNIESSLNYFLKQRINKNYKILDIGCNYGSLIYNLYKQGYKNVNGIDINEESIKRGKYLYKEVGHKIKLYNGKKIPYNEESFDIVLMFDVIEHIPNIKGFLRDEVYRVLKKDGIFIFQTPNKLTNIPWEIINQRSLAKWKIYHVSLQTKGKLKELLKTSGFKDIKIEKYNIYTAHNLEKLGKRLTRPIAIIVLFILSLLPLSLYPNFWGSAIKC